MTSGEGAGSEGPTSLLPLEILCHIFLECRNGDIDEHLGPLSSPALLMQVCRYWRLVVCATPVLWTKLNIGSTTLRLKSPALLISSYVAYSSGLLIDVIINSNLSLKTLDRFDVIVPSLQETFATCFSLHITVSIWHLQLVRRLFPPGSESSLPMLESLNLHALTGKINAPRLRGLITTGLEDLQYMIGAARDSLRHLSIFGIVPSEPASLYFPNITHLQLTLYEPNDPPYRFISSAMITKVLLKWLYTRDSTPARILDYVDLPSLETLDLFVLRGGLHDPPESEDIQYVPITDLISRQNWDRFKQQLISLHLTRIDISAYHNPFNLDSSSYFTNLQELELTECPQFNLIICSLAYQERDAFPELRSLTIRANAIVSEDGMLPSISKQILLGTTQLRASRGRLKFVELALPGTTLSQEDLQRVQYLRDRHGIEVVM
jgi:hypothetical protein